VVIIKVTERRERRNDEVYLHKLSICFLWESEMVFQSWTQEFKRGIGEIVGICIDKNHLNTCSVFRLDQKHSVDKNTA
jgi:hypothetical protein